MNRFLATLFAIFLFLPVAAQAQDYPMDKGSYLLGGSASFRTTGVEGNDDRRTNISIRPTFQTFVSPGFAIGGEFSLESSSGGGNSATSFGVGPTLSYFFGDEDVDAYPFISGNVSYQSLFDGNTTGVRGRASAGVSVMLAKNIALTPELFFAYDQLNVDGRSDSITRNEFGAAIGVTGFVF